MCNVSSVCNAAKGKPIMPMHSEHGIFTRGFSSEKCIQCGKCLAGCQYRELTPKQARDVMKKITVRPQWYTELDSCIRCGKCDHRCPNDAHPSNLMRECLEHNDAQNSRSLLPWPMASMAWGRKAGVQISLKMHTKALAM